MHHFAKKVEKVLKCIKDVYLVTKPFKQSCLNQHWINKDNIGKWSSFCKTVFSGDTFQNKISELILNFSHLFNRRGVFVFV